MELYFFDLEEVVAQKDRILAEFQDRFSAADFVLIRDTLSKHVDEALEETKRFEETLRVGDDAFVNDVRNDDPLAFVVRGALHIETRLAVLLQALHIRIRERDTFNERIRLLEQSGRLPTDSINLLDEIRGMRNAVAHELEAGRTVSVHVVERLKTKLSPERLARLHRVCGHDPLILEAAGFARLVMNNLFTELDGKERQIRRDEEIRRVLGIRSGVGSQPR